MKQRIMKFMIIAAIALGGFGLFNSVLPVSAASDSVEVKVDVPASTNTAISITEVNSNTSVANTIETHNASNDITLNVEGVGRVVIRDQDGNILYEYEKTTPGSEQVVAHITLPHGVGVYEIVAQIIGEDGTNTARITLDYRALSLWPNAPNTGAYLYVVGYAVPVSGLAFWSVILGILGAGLWFIFTRRRRKQSETESATSNEM